VIWRATLLQLQQGRHRLGGGVIGGGPPPWRRAPPAAQIEDPPLRPACNGSRPGVSAASQSGAALPASALEERRPGAIGPVALRIAGFAPTAGRPAPPGLRRERLQELLRRLAPLPAKTPSHPPSATRRSGCVAVKAGGWRPAQRSGA